MNVEINEAGNLEISLRDMLDGAPDKLLLEIAKHVSTTGVVMDFVVQMLIDGIFIPADEPSGAYWGGYDDEMQAARLKLLAAIPDVKARALAGLLTVVERAREDSKQIRGWNYKMAQWRHAVERREPAGEIPEPPDVEFCYIHASEVLGWLNEEIDGNHDEGAG